MHNYSNPGFKQSSSALYNTPPPPYHHYAPRIQTQNIPTPMKSSSILSGTRAKLIVLFGAIGTVIIAAVIAIVVIYAIGKLKNF